MKIKLILFFTYLIIVSINSIAQDYSEYYEGINNAKLALINADLEQAEDCYYQTFEDFDFVYARDCYNALEISTKLKHFDKINYFMKRCIKQGVEFAYLERQEMMSDYKKTTLYSEFLLNKDSLRNIYESKINWGIRNEIIEMFTKDQMIRKRYYKAILFKRRKIGRDWEALNKMQVERLIEITKKHGFPGEKLIGIDAKKMHHKINDFDLSAGMPIIIFIHHYSQPNESYNSILKPEIKKGNLWNEHYAIISDFQYTYGKQKYGLIPCYSLRFKPKESKEQIDRNRLEIGLLSWSNTKKLESRKYLTPFWIRLR